MNLGRKIRVVHIVQALERGGMEEVVATYAARLNREEFDVSVAAFVGGLVAQRIAAIPDVTLKLLHVPPLERTLKLERWLNEIKPDVVHNHCNWYGLTAAWMAGVPVRVETVHNLYRWLGTLKRTLYSATLLPATHLIAVSKCVEEYTRSRFWGARTKPFSVVTNGVDAGRFAPGERNEALRTSLGLSTKGMVLGFLGRLEREKNLGALLEAADIVAGEGNPLTVLLAGEGSSEPLLREKAASLRHARVVFAGYTERPEEILRLMDVLVFPSLYEGLPLGLLQGMATGKPVIVTRVGGMPEVVRDGQDGIIVPPGNVGALADAIRAIASDNGTMQKMGVLGREHVLAEHTEDGMVRRTEELYRELLAAAEE